MLANLKKDLKGSDIMAQNSFVQSAERIFSILEILAEKGPMTLTEISKELNLHKTTVSRLAGSLISMGYAKRNIDGRYALTFKMLGLAGRMLEKTDIISISRPHMERLAQISGETVHFVRREGAWIVYIDKVESNANSVRMVSRIGLRQPAYCTAVGKAMLAELELEEVREIWNGSEIKKYTPNTITDFDVLQKELENIREKGYAIDNEENELGVRCIAASVKNFEGRADNAFSISAPVSRLGDEKIEVLSRYLLEIKEKLSRELGGIL